MQVVAKSSGDHLALTAEVVSAYVSNWVPVTDLPALICAIHRSMIKMPEGDDLAEPAVPVKRSITTDYIVCLEDGKRLKSLKRRLSAVYGLTPDAYRAKWGLPSDYPMVAAAYSAKRSILAKAPRLGKRRRAAKTAQA